VSISTVVISGNAYTVYASVTEADAILLVDSRRASAWSALLVDAKAARLAEATRLLDELRWRGSPTVPGQRFPRTGLTDLDGVPVTDSDVPSEVEYACAQLAADLTIAGESAVSGGSNIKRVEAGAVVVEFFEAVNAEVTPPEYLKALAHMLRSSGTYDPGTAFGEWVSSCWTPPEFF